VRLSVPGLVGDVRLRRWAVGGDVDGTKQGCPFGARILFEDRQQVEERPNRLLKKPPESGAFPVSARVLAFLRGISSGFLCPQGR
jgi:hypothetical protein